MPINVPNGLPAFDTLVKENIFAMPILKAQKQDIRPLEIIVLNLMPVKTSTESQLIRLLSNTALQIELTLLKTQTYVSKNVSSIHLENFYQSFEQIKKEQKSFDGLIITGAPVETKAFEDVDYWDELCEILTWSKTNVFSTMHICWGAMAGLYFDYNIKKYPLNKKLFGVFEHQVDQTLHSLVRGFDEVFFAPHSRYAQINEDDVKTIEELEVLISSKDAGLYLIASRDIRQFYIMGHPEYDTDALELEYIRDLSNGLSVELPVNYFPDNDPSKKPKNNWRGHAHLLIANWLNEIYQKTPYDLMQMKNIINFPGAEP